MLVSVTSNYSFEGNRKSNIEKLQSKASQHEINADKYLGKYNYNLFPEFVANICVS